MIELNRDKLLIFFICSSLLFPQLPPIFIRSEIHINFYSILLALFFIINFKIHMGYRERLLIFGYFIIMQVLLIISYLFGVEFFESYGELPSLFRPIMLLIVTLGFSSLLGNDENIYDSLLSAAKIIVLLVFIYSLLEVFSFEAFSGIMFLLYRIQDKSNIDGVAVSFFTLPYYASYVLSIFLPLLLSNARRCLNITSISFVLMCIFSVVLTQSKTGIFLSILIVFIYLYMSSSSFSKLLVVTLFVFISLLAIFFLKDFVIYLNEEYGGNFAKTLDLILSGSDQAYNLTERQDDITSTFYRVIQVNPFIGLGLGKGETIEVWVASIIYRYGLLGLFYFTAYFVVIGLYSFQKIRLSDHSVFDTNIELLKMVSIWALTIFISQLSSFMLEMSKCGVLSCLMFALMARLLSRPIK